MQFVVPRDQEVASLPRRAVAGTIDAACLMAACGVLLGAAAGIAAASGRSGALPRWFKRIGDGKTWLHPALTGASGSLQLIGRNWRSPGQRATGIRRGAAPTRRPVSVRSACVALALQTGTQRISVALNQPANARAEARRLAANDEIERMRASRPDGDREELMHDELAIRQRLGVSTCTRMLPQMLVRTALDWLPPLWSGRRQSLTERLSGTVLVLDR